MRRMYLVLLSLLLILCIGQPSFAASYTINFGYVQNRTYEDGTSFNRLAVGVIDENGNYPEVEIITSKQLTDPNDCDVWLKGWKFGTWNEYYSTFDETSGFYIAPDQNTYGSYYYAQIKDPLIPGGYEFKANYNDGIDSGTVERTFNFNPAGEGLPVVSAKSFEYQFTGDGRFVWSWDVPEDLPEGVDTSIRALMYWYDDGEEWSLMTRVPTELGYLELPEDIAEHFRELDFFNLRIQLRTNDNSFRTYSNWVAVGDAPPASVPEPASIFLLGVGFLGLAGLGRKRLFK